MAVSVAVFEARNFVLLADVELAIEDGERGGFVETAHNAFGFDRGAVGLGGDSGDFVNLTFEERGLVLTIGAEHRDKEIVAPEGHGRNLKLHLVRWIDILQFYEGVE